MCTKSSNSLNNGLSENHYHSYSQIRRLRPGKLTCLRVPIQQVLCDLLPGLQRTEQGYQMPASHLFKFWFNNYETLIFKASLLLIKMLKNKNPSPSFFFVDING